MLKLLLLLLAATVSFRGYAQISFEKGYYVDNDGLRVACLIKNVDWKNNPTAFKYKRSEEGAVEEQTIATVQEFGVYDFSKYVRRNVDIDRSSEDIRRLSKDKNPVFEQEQLFLKVLIEGKASLYQYEDKNLTRFFFSQDSADPEQLVFKSYETSENKIGRNEGFKQQLWNSLQCPAFTVEDIRDIHYLKNDLVAFFKKYNECYDQPFVNFEKKQKRDLINVSLRIGLNHSSLAIQNSDTKALKVDFGSQIGLRLGVEAEFILPFNKNKWAVMIEPTYQYFKVETVFVRRDVQVSYQSVELPIGLRHYFFLSQHSKIFINGSLVLDFARNASIDFASREDLKIKSRPNAAFGVGYKYHDRYGLEVRYQTSREVLSDYIYWSSDYHTWSVIVGYTVF